MTGYQRMAAVLHGEPPDTAPIMLHNFMMAAHEAGVSMRAFRSDPGAIARSFIEAVERYAYDAILVDVDTVTLAGALGVPVDFPENEPARAAGALLRNLRDRRCLPVPDVSAYPGVQVWLEAVSRLKGHFGNEIHVRGNCDQCPFALAALVRGMEDWFAELMDPAMHEEAHGLLGYCTEATMQFLRLMAAAGADSLSNGDSTAGPDVVSPGIYRAFALPYEQRVVAEAHRLGLPYVLHICGDTTAILDDMIGSGADGLELDYKTDAQRACQKMKDRAVFIGNIDPSGVLALGGPGLVERTTRNLLDVFSENPRFVLNAGCAIPPTTPPENLRTMIRVCRER